MFSPKTPKVLKANPLQDNLRADQRFVALLKRPDLFNKYRQAACPYSFGSVSKI